MSISLPHQKTNSSPRLANRTPTNIQLERFSSPTENQIKNLPVNQEKATQLSSPEALQTTHYYESQGGYQVKFIQQKQGWMACVQEVFPGFHGSFSLPVYCIGMTIQDLARYKETKRYIQVNLPTNDRRQCNLC